MTIADEVRTTDMVSVQLSEATAAALRLSHGLPRHATLSMDLIQRSLEIHLARVIHILSNSPDLGEGSPWLALMDLDLVKFERKLDEHVAGEYRKPIR